jgi:isopentenyl-diphosphate delta-isomerase
MQVIKVDKNDQRQGFIEKQQAHKKGVLHRAFSIFIFNEAGELLVQQRSAQKQLWPLSWSNSCCSHPLPEEPTKQAAERRLKEELGFTTQLKRIYKFHYKKKFEDVGYEHELCHVFVGDYSGKAVPDKKEINDYQWIEIDELKEQIKDKPEQFTPWFKMEVEKLGKSGVFNDKEVFPLVNKKGQVVGQAARKECHQNPDLLHPATNIILFNQQGEVLLQQRSENKDLYPGQWTTSTSGHLKLEETYQQAAAREIKEELGIDYPVGKLQPLGKYLNRTAEETELVGFFAGIYNGGVDFNKEEINKIKWIDAEKLFKQLEQNKIKATPCTAGFLKKKANRQAIIKLIKAND